MIEQIAKDMRSQQLTQKEVAGQLFMYSIFIAFAGLIAAPVLYGLTAQMIIGNRRGMEGHTHTESGRASDDWNIIS